MHYVRNALSRLLQFQRNLGVFVTRSERRYAMEASKQLLVLFRSKQRQHPDPSRRALYEAVIAERLGPETSKAAEVIRRAEESFTDWPVERELKLRHVVHYQIFNEHIRGSSARQGTQTNMGVVVARIIPEEI
jgi:hypothetical protein